MSRIGKLPIAVPAGVDVKIGEGNLLTVKGPKGTLERILPAEMEIKMGDGHVVVTRPNDLKKNQIFTRFDKNLDFQHGCWCNPGISESSGSKRCWLQSSKSR